MQKVSPQPLIKWWNLPTCKKEDFILYQEPCREVSVGFLFLVKKGKEGVLQLLLGPVDEKEVIGGTGEGGVEPVDIFAR